MMKTFASSIGVISMMIASVVLVWGAGSAMMNGIRESSMGICLVIFAVAVMISWLCLVLD